MMCPLCRGEAWDACEDPRGASCCRECGGVWSPASLAPGGPVREELNPVDAGDQPVKPKICPDCGHLLEPLSTSAAPRLRVDRCLGCAGAWFDPAAWREIVVLGVEQHWRRAAALAPLADIDAVSLDAVREASFAALLGPAEHGRLRDIRYWIERHPAKDVMLAYLREHDEARWRSRG